MTKLSFIKIKMSGCYNYAEKIFSSKHHSSNWSGVSRISNDEHNWHCTWLNDLGKVKLLDFIIVPQWHVLKFKVLGKTIHSCRITILKIVPAAQSIFLQWNLIIIWKRWQSLSPLLFLFLFVTVQGTSSSSGKVWKGCSQITEISLPNGAVSSFMSLVSLSSPTVLSSLRSSKFLKVDFCK